jgi:hypothetical protein
MNKEKKLFDILESKELPVYEAPEITTYTDEEILEELGPAQANVYDRPFN